MARNKPILPSQIPIETVDDWTERFEKLFKQRDYGTLKDKEKKR